MKGSANPKLGKCSLVEFYEITCCFNEWFVLLKHHKINTAGQVNTVSQANISRENVKKNSV